MASVSICELVFVCEPVSGVTTGAVVAIVIGTLVFVFLFVCVIQLCYKYVYVLSFGTVGIFVLLKIANGKINIVT